MHCYAFKMLYLKDGPLRRSSECIGLRNVVPKRRPLRTFDYFFAKYIKHQGGEGGGNEG